MHGQLGDMEDHIILKVDNKGVVKSVMEDRELLGMNLALLCKLGC